MSGITLRELSTDGKAVNPDNLHPVALEKMAPVNEKLLLTLFYRVPEDKDWPFSNYEVNFILKSRKYSYLGTGSSRLIIKTSHIGNLMERKMKDRIMSHLLDNNLEDPIRVGFRKKPVNRKDIKDHMANIKDCWSEIIVLEAPMVDLEKAADSVWMDSWLANKNALPGYPRYAWSLIRNFRSNGSFSIRMDGLKSEYKSTAGLPQGSVVSHILFNIFVHDMCCNLVKENSSTQLIS